MDLNLGVFQEPRGVMRILQFFFSISAFASTCNYVGKIIFNCSVPYTYEYSYPFNLQLSKELTDGQNNCHPQVTIMEDYSSDAEYFVATGVIAMLYSIAACVLYTKFDEKYKTNPKLPMIDFLMSVFIAVLWLSSSASFANSLSGIKHATTNINWTNIDKSCSHCPVSNNSYSSLNIAVVFGFLNFFVWAADLWFLYKETTWFQNRAELPEPN